MAKAKTVYVCAECGAVSPRWLGRCPGCNAWNTLSEERDNGATSTRLSARAASPGREQSQRLSEVSPDAARRIHTGIGELDRVLGGGLVAGGVVLVGGDPGIGKSSLLLQALAGVAATGARTLYVTGEESRSQIALRAERIKSPGVDQVHVLATADLEDITHAVNMEQPLVMVVDSIQTMRCAELESVAGSVGQLREVTARLVDLAKARGIAVFLIGHVTKEGAIAGPKLLEHLVDTVLNFEGDATLTYRLIRSSKNRFGPAQELGVFEMVREGLREVVDPSRLFLAERPAHASGSLVFPSAQGQRPLLLEVQALLAPAVYGSARRVATGLDASRLAILLAVLDRKAHVQVFDQDVFVSVVGGARVDEPAVDLALAIAIVSSLRDRPVAHELIAFGEVGLTGEVRGVPRAASRLAEARKLGFTHAILPQSSLERLEPSERQGIELVGVRTLHDALAAALQR
ncbi:MAG TPA: DNA repair protein RadA [Polyangiales bacterium]|nr:DNA repair protein RadA [Polyangiales bacterium]